MFEKKKEKAMKNVKKNSKFSVVLGIVLCASVFWLGGCGYVERVGMFADQLIAGVWTLGSDPEAHAQLGETEAEGRRRHIRAARINQQELMEDIDRALLLDKPSKLTGKRIP